jgi:hypothetical protein
MKGVIPAKLAPECRYRGAGIQSRIASLKWG